MNAKLWQLSVTVPVAAEAPLQVWMRRATGQAAVVYAPAESASVVVSFYFTREEPARAARTALAEGIALVRAAGAIPGRARIRWRAIPRRNWAEAWKHHFPPLRIGRRLCIQPTWVRRSQAEITVRLDPGLSFGTGHHPTTRFCLAQLLALRRREGTQSFCDLGTGSGILAITAARLGYGPVVALDHDATAIRVARENARLNGVGTAIQFIARDICGRARPAAGRFDLVCANLTADLLQARSVPIAGMVAAAGFLVVAGVLRTEFAAVARSYRRAGLSLRKSSPNGAWKSAVFEKFPFASGKDADYIT